MKKILKKAVSTFAFEIFCGIIKWILVFTILYEGRKV